MKKALPPADPIADLQALDGWRPSLVDRAPSPFRAAPARRKMEASDLSEGSALPIRAEHARALVAAAMRLGAELGDATRT